MKLKTIIGENLVESSPDYYEQYDYYYDQIMDDLKDDIIDSRTTPVIKLADDLGYSKQDVLRQLNDSGYAGVQIHVEDMAILNKNIANFRRGVEEQGLVWAIKTYGIHPREWLLNFLRNNPNLYQELAHKAEDRVYDLLGDPNSEEN